MISNILISLYLHQPEVLFPECVLKYKFNLKPKCITSQNLPLLAYTLCLNIPGKFQKNTVGPFWVIQDDALFGAFTLWIFLCFCYISKIMWCNHNRQRCRKKELSLICLVPCVGIIAITERDTERLLASMKASEREEKAGWKCRFWKFFQFFELETSKNSPESLPTPGDQGKIWETHERDGPDCQMLQKVPAASISITWATD